MDGFIVCYSEKKNLFEFVKVVNVKVKESPTKPPFEMISYFAPKPIERSHPWTTVFECKTHDDFNMTSEFLDKISVPTGFEIFMLEVHEDEIDSMIRLRIEEMEIEP